MKVRGTNKVGKFKVKKVKNKGVVSKNVVRVAITPLKSKMALELDMLNRPVVSASLHIQ